MHLNTQHFFIHQTGENMSTTTYTIFQSNVKSQLDGTISLTIKDEAAGYGEASMVIDGITFKALTMDNWTCYDDKNKMIWVFYPDAKLERDSNRYQNPKNRDPDLSKYTSAIGYTFASYPNAKHSKTIMVPPKSGGGTGGN